MDLSENQWRKLLYLVDEGVLMTETMTPKGYLPRVVDRQVDRYLRIFGAVEIAGTKWCGKTWTTLHHASSVSYVDDNVALAKSDPSLMLLGAKPHAVDEWQLAPRIWDATRRAVDAERGLRGGWILTGSSTPLVRDGGADTPSHTGAGRIGRIRMYPMTLAESGDSNGSVSLAGLFAGEFQPAVCDDDSMALIKLCCRGGWPEAIDMDVESAQTLAREYLKLFYSESAERAGKDADVAAKLVGSLARNLAQAVTYKTLVCDMYGEEEDASSMVSEQTVASYLTFLKASYLVDEVPGWVPPARSRKRLATKPKRYLADPSLAAAQLGMGPSALLADWQTFGLLFESLCMRDLTVYARALPEIGFEPVRYYRDDTGLEADAVVELADGRWAAFEFKVSEDKVQDAVDNLLRLKRKLCAKGASRTRDPEFLALVTGLSKYARVTPEGVYVIPIRALTA